MERGAILPPVSTAVLQPAAPAGTPQRSIAVIAIRQALGASTVIPSTGVQKPALAAAHRPMTMLTTAILMVHGPERMMRSTNARKPALLAKHPVKNTPTMWMPTAMESATIAARPFR